MQLLWSVMLALMVGDGVEEVSEHLGDVHWRVVFLHTVHQQNPTLVKLREGNVLIPLVICQYALLFPLLIFISLQKHFLTLQTVSL